MQSNTNDVNYKSNLPPYKTYWNNVPFDIASSFPVNVLGSTTVNKIGKLSVYPQLTMFVNNTYLDVSMGVTNSNYTSPYIVRGSVHKLYGVMAADFSGESYSNIMGHTSEHL